MENLEINKEKMGNIREEKMEDIWFSDRAKMVRKRLNKKSIQTVGSPTRPSAAC